MPNFIRILPLGMEISRDAKKVLTDNGRTDRPTDNPRT